MIVIGVDTHKRSHTLVALDAATGATRGGLTIPAGDEGTLNALRFAGELDEERVWAVEDCRHVSGRLERGLLASGDRVVRVAPGLTESSRRAVRSPGSRTRSTRPRSLAPRSESRLLARYAERSARSSEARGFTEWAIFSLSRIASSTGCPYSVITRRPPSW